MNQKEKLFSYEKNYLIVELLVYLIVLKQFPNNGERIDSFLLGCNTGSSTNKSQSGYNTVYI